VQRKTKEDNMLKLFSKEKPSKTAYNAAWFRACSHKDFQDQIWGPDFILFIGVFFEKVRLYSKDIFHSFPMLFHSFNVLITGRKQS
jgi:hypothetical protein